MTDSIECLEQFDVAIGNAREFLHHDGDEAA